MKAKEKAEIREIIEAEGFDYTFIDYSHFENIKDERFHQLRRAYVDACKALAAYIGLEDA